MTELFSLDMPPAFIFLGGALLIPVLRGKLRAVWMLALPVVAFMTIAHAGAGDHWAVSFLGHDLVFERVDRLSTPFGFIFAIVTFIGVLFALRVKDTIQHVAAFMYAGGALGVTFAGDLFSLYIFWEVMAVASTFLILARRTKKSQAAAFRYIMVHLAGGLVLLAGIVLRVSQTGSLAFGHMELNGLDTWLIFIGFAVNAAIPPLHPWLKDAYPEATVTGAVFLSALTTKSAVYVMARGFAGTELLIVLGAFMTAFPIFYAVLENDIRRVLSYSLMNQVGFMLCGIGIGTELAINGTVSHAFCHILYKALLFMAAGSVLYMTGKIRCTDLGGLYKTMPLTCILCIVGSASISGFPLFSGFVSKSMVISAAGHGHFIVIWFILQFASAGVLDHAGIKVPFFMFFSHDSGIRAKDPPLNMLLAMGIAAVLCIGLGVYPKPLYDILPYPVDYVPYTGAHVVGMLQLLLFGALAFVLLLRAGFYPAEVRAINLDTDWFYRKGGGLFYTLFDRVLNGFNAFCDRTLAFRFTRALARSVKTGPAYAASALLVPMKFMTDLKKDDRGTIIEKVKAALETGTVPVGVSALAAALILILLYLLI